MTTTPNLLLTHLEANASSPEIRVNELADGLDYGLNSYFAKNFTTDADLTLATTGTVPQEWQHGFVNLTDSGVVLTTGRNVIVPVNEKKTVFKNSTAQTITVKTSGGTGVAITAGGVQGVQCDGTNVISADGGGGSFANVVEDVTPQLGGDLDVNGQSIVSVSAGDILITPDTTGSIVLDGLSWPQADGTNAQVIQTDGAGNLSFVTGGSTDGNAIHDNVAGEIAALTTVTAASGDYVLIEDVSDSNNKKKVLVSDFTGGAITESLIIAIGDETTAITTGTAKVTFRMPYAFTLSAVRASLTTVSSSGIPTFDINETGTTILSTKLTIDASEKTSTTAVTAAVISDTALADDAEITIDVDVAGTGAAGAKIYLIGTQV